MTWLERLQTAYDVEPDAGFGPPTIDVESEAWLESARIALETLGCGFFDFLTAVDELDEGFTVVTHLASPGGGNVDSLLLRTKVSRDQRGLACICGVYSGAGWHERETYEMFGIGFIGHEALDPLLLPDGFEGHPLRKDFVLVSRVAKPFPGAKEPGESDGDAAPSRRRMRPPGVPDPGEWGPRASRLDSAE